MAGTDEECQKRFQAAVDVIHSLPKNGSYRPSYDVMLRFYSLYKQVVCGPCRGSRPGFWDPVGRYKWDAWSRLGEMSREVAMKEYVEEMKKVAQEVIDTMQVNEKTASFFHYFEPLYLVIHDMPRPPDALMSLRAELEGGAQAVSPAEKLPENRLKDKMAVTKDVSCKNPCESQESAPAEPLVVTSDSESEVFCDSLDQLDLKSVLGSDDLKCAQHHTKQVGSGQGGEGAQERGGPPRRERGHSHRRREESSGRLHGGMHHGGNNEFGEGGGDGWDGRPSWQWEAQMQQQIVLALRQLREDMHSVTERLKALEKLAAAQAENSECRAGGCITAPTVQQGWWWWPPLDVSGHTLLLLMLWPFIAQWLVFMWRRRSRTSHLL